MTTLVPIELIASKIYLIRGIKVILDRDLAELYGVETKVLKQAVRRNIERFPADFMFELTNNENQSLRSQNVTLKRGQHSKYLPFAFTEHGVLMLSSVYSLQRPLRRAYQQDKELVDQWLTKEYPQIRKMARKEKAEIFFGDEASIRSDYHSGTT